MTNHIKFLLNKVFFERIPSLVPKIEKNSLIMNDISSTTKFQEIKFLFFYFGLVALVVVGLFGNFLSSLYYIVYLDTNVILVFLVRILFAVLCLLGAFSKSFRISFVCFTLIFLGYAEKLLGFLQKSLEKNPFFVVLVFHLYICLSFLHLLMVYSTGIELVIEYFYQVINLLRIFFLPIFIIWYISYFGQSFFKMIQITPEAFEALVKVINNSITALTTQTKGSPKTTGVALAGTAILGAGLIYGQNVKEVAEGYRMASGLPAPSEMDAQIFKENPEAEEMFDTFLELTLTLQHSRLSITKNDLYAMYQGNPTLLEEFKSAVKGLTKAQILSVKEQDALNKSQQFADSIMSPAARVVSQDTEVNSLIASTSSQQPTSNSPLELLLF